MLKKHIVKKLTTYFQYNFTPSQEILIEGLAEFINPQSEESILIIKGFAGTGKTPQKY